MKDWYFTITYIKVQNKEETIVTEQPTYVFREYSYAEDSAKKCIEKLRLQKDIVAESIKVKYYSHEVITNN